MRRSLSSIAILLLAAGNLGGQTAAPLPAFDVASVRPSGPRSPQHTNVPLDAGNVYSTISPDDARSAAGGLLIATHQPMWRYISFAYKLSGTQELALRFNMFSGMPKSGAPQWVTGGFDAGADAFDIEARAPANTTIDQMRLMMQSLLADRFHLAVHYTTADAPVFALILVHPGTTGPDLRPHPASDPCTAPGASSSSSSSGDRVGTTDSAAPATTASAAGVLPPVCGVIAHVPSSAPGQHFGGRAVPLSLFASSVPTMTGLAAMPRPVVDQTGLGGLYDFTLSWVLDASGTDSSVSDNITAFHEALKTQLGLELKSARAPIELLIVDHIEHPSAN